MTTHIPPLTTEKAAAYLGMPVKSFRKLYRDGHIPKLDYPGQRLYFDVRDLDEFLRRVRVPAVR